MSKRTYLIGSEIVPPVPLPAPLIDAPVIRLVMRRSRPDSGVRPDYAGMARAANKLVGMSRQIAARAAKTEECARVARETAALRAQVQSAFRPPAGRLFVVDVEALMLIGPGVMPVLVRTWRSYRLPARTCRNRWWGPDGEMRTISATDCLPPPASCRQSAVGLTLSRRKAGLRITRAKP